MKRKFKVLYTHQKTKKKKVWQDGILTVPVGGSRAFLSDETNRQISAVYLNKKVVKNGIDLESDKYLIQVEEEESDVKSENSLSITVINSSHLNQEIKSKFKPVFSQAKRVKRSGFVVPRRTTQPESPNCTKSQLISNMKEIKEIDKKTSSIWTSNISSDSSSDENSFHHTPTKLLNTANSKHAHISNQRNANDVLDLLNSGVKDFQQSSVTSSNAAVKSRKSISCLSDTMCLSSTSSYTNNKNIDIENSNSNRIKPIQQSIVPMQQNIESRKTNVVQHEQATEAKQHMYQIRKDNLKEILESKIFFPTFKQCKLNKKFPISPESPPMIYETLDEYLLFWCKYTTRSINKEIFEIATSYYELIESADMSNCPQLSNSYKSKINVKENKVKINNTRSVISYLSRDKINMFINCTLKRLANLATENYQTQSKKKQLFVLELTSEERCLVKCKGAYFAVSKSLNFTKEETFVGKSVSNFDKSTLKIILEPNTSHNQCWNNQNGLFVIHLTKNFNDEYYEVINKYLSRSPIYKQIINPQVIVHKKKQLLDDDLLGRSLVKKFMNLQK